MAVMDWLLGLGLWADLGDSDFGEGLVGLSRVIGVRQGVVIKLGYFVKKFKYR